MTQNSIHTASRIVTAALVVCSALVSGPGFNAYGASNLVRPAKVVSKRVSFPKCFADADTRVACVAELNQIIDAGEFAEADLDDVRFNLRPGEVSDKVIMAAITVNASNITNKNDAIGNLIIASDFSKFSKNTLNKLTDYLLAESCSERGRNFGYHIYYVSGAAPLTNDSMKKIAESLNENCQEAKKRPWRFEPISGFLFESSDSVSEPMRSQIIRYYSTNRSIGGLPGESIDGRATIIEFDYRRPKYVHIDRPVSLAAVARMNEMGSSLNDQEFSDLLAVEAGYALDGTIEDRSIHTEILNGALNTYDRAVIARRVMGRWIEPNVRWTKRYLPGPGLVAGTGLTGASTLTRSKSFLTDMFANAARRAKLFRVHQLPASDAKRFAEFVKAEIMRRTQSFSDHVKSDQVADFPNDELTQLLVDMRILRNIAPKAQDIRTFANLLAQAKQTPFQGSDIGLVVALAGLYDSPMNLAQKSHVVRYIDGWNLGNKIDVYVYSIFLLTDTDPLNPAFQKQFNMVNVADGSAKHRLFDGLELFFGTMGLNEKVWSERFAREKRIEWYRAKTGVLKTKGYVVPDIEMIP